MGVCSGAGRWEGVCKGTDGCMDGAKEVWALGQSGRWVCARGPSGAYIGADGCAGVSTGAFRGHGCVQEVRWVHTGGLVHTGGPRMHAGGRWVCARGQ